MRGYLQDSAGAKSGSAPLHDAGSPTPPGRQPQTSSVPRPGTGRSGPGPRSGVVGIEVAVPQQGIKLDLDALVSFLTLRGTVVSLARHPRRLRRVGGLHALSTTYASADRSRPGPGSSRWRAPTPWVTAVSQTFSRVAASTAAHRGGRAVVAAVSGPAADRQLTRQCGGIQTASTTTTATSSRRQRPGVAHPGEAAAPTRSAAGHHSVDPVFATSFRWCFGQRRAGMRRPSPHQRGAQVFRPAGHLRCTSGTAVRRAVGRGRGGFCTNGVW